MARGVNFYLQDHKDSVEVGRQALHGGLISIASGYGGGALQIIAAVILARLLTPHDFGLVAIITTLTSFAPFLIDFGMADATVQRSRLTQGQASSVFWISCGIGFAIAASLAVFSGPIASLYNEPSLRLIALCSAMTFAISGLSGQHLSLLRRALQFKTIAKIQFVAVLASVAIAILLALCGAGYWALVIRPIANATLVTVGAWLGCAWRPGLPSFDNEVKSMARFGWHVVVFGIAYSFSRAADRIGLGLFYSPKDVGFYQTAVTLYEYSLFSTSTLIHTVGSAALSKLQSNHAALSLKYETALSTLAFFMMPAAAILSLTAQDVVVIILGDQWRPTGVLLSILAVRGIFLAIEGSHGWLHLSLGRPDRWKNWGIITAIVQVVAVLCGLPFGIKGVAIATVVASALLAFPSISYAGRPAGIGTVLVLRATGRQLIGALLCAAAGWLIQAEMLHHVSSLGRISVLACISIAFYLLIVAGLLRLTEPIWIMTRLVNQQLLPRATALLDSRLFGGLKQTRPKD